MALRAYSGGAFFGEVHGEGRPQVLALHGWKRSSADFASLLSGLPALALDLPGFGASPPPGEPWGAAGYAGAIASVLDEFPEPPIVLAHSFGGRVAVHLAGLGPVASLALIGVPLIRPAGTRKNPPLSFRLVRYLHKLGMIDDERMEQARRTHGSADYRAAEGVMRAVLVTVVNESYEKELDNLSIPVRMLWGADDAAAPVAAAQLAYERLVGRGADVTFEVLEGVGHDVHLERPDRVLAMLNDLGLRR